jgi:two-component system, OmpR family, alkaline phosphatase synthesis response regulator PhoP
MWKSEDVLERYEPAMRMDITAALFASSATAANLRALVVTEEVRVRALVRLHLGSAGFDVTELADGARAVTIGRTARFEVIVLDVRLPTVDGITVCRALRAHGPNLDTPILMLIAADRESDTIATLETGADDYITKPFGIHELAARINVLLRRQNRTPRTWPNQTSVIERLGVLVNVDKRTAIANGQVVNLTKQEFDLLHVLVSRPGIVFSREALLSKVWGCQTYVVARAVDAVISRLRKKLEPKPHDPQLILTVWGVGYKCADVEYAG